MTPGLRRHLLIVAYTAGSLARRWRKNVAVVGVYGLVIFSLASVVFLTQSLTLEAVATLRTEPEILVQRLSAGRHGLTPIGDAAGLTRIAGVYEAFPRLWAYYAEPVSGETLLVRVPEVDPPRGPLATAGAEFLRRRAIPVGGSIRLTGHAGEPLELSVSGVAETTTRLESAALLNVSETVFRKLTGMPDGQATDLGLRVRNRRELPTIAEKISRILPDARPIIRDELVRTYTSVFNWRSGVVIAALLVSVLAFIIFAWDKAAGLSPDERREIGILKAVGWETADVILLKVYEAVSVSLIAFMLGAALAVAALAFPHPLAMLPALIGWSTLYPSFRPAAVLGAYQVTTLFFLAVFPYLVATLIPAWRAATTDPDLVMRT